MILSFCPPILNALTLCLLEVAVSLHAECSLSCSTDRLLQSHWTWKTSRKMINVEKKTWPALGVVWDSVSCLRTLRTVNFRRAVGHHFTTWVTAAPKQGGSTLQVNFKASLCYKSYFGLWEAEPNRQGWRHGYEKSLTHCGLAPSQRVWGMTNIKRWEWPAMDQLPPKRSGGCNNIRERKIRKAKFNENGALWAAVAD